MSQEGVTAEEGPLKVYVVTEMHTRNMDDGHTDCMVHGVFKDEKEACNVCYKLFTETVMEYSQYGPLKSSGKGGGRNFWVRQSEGSEYDSWYYEVTETTVQ